MIEDKHGTSIDIVCFFRGGNYHIKTYLTIIQTIKKRTVSQRTSTSMFLILHHFK